MRLILAILLVAASVSAQPYTFGDYRVYQKTPPPSGPTNLTAGLLAWWKMDEGTGTAVGDSSGNGLNATFNTQTPIPTWVAGKIGAGALAFGTPALCGFATTTSSISLSNTSGVIGLSVTWWQYSVSAFNNSITRSLFTQTKTNAPAWSFHGQIFNNNTVYLGWANATLDKRLTFAATAAMFPQNTWIHYAYVCDGSGSRFYTNSILAVSSATSPAGCITNMQEPIMVGTLNSTDLGFGGRMDDFRIYTNALSGNDISYLYHTWYGQP